MQYKKPFNIPSYFSYGLSGLLAAFVFFFIIPSAHAAIVTWDGGGADNNWSTAANWSGDVAPTSSDVATFDATSTKAATIDVSINVSGIDINTGYTGTITQGSGNTVTIGSGNYDQADGTFTGGDSTIDLNGTFTLSSGTFTSTSGEFHNGPSTGTSLGTLPMFTMSGGTFNHNNGTVVFDPTEASNAGTTTYSVDLNTSLTLYNVEVAGTDTSFTTPSEVSVASGDTLTVANNLTHTNNVVKGAWNVQGNIIIGSGADATVSAGDSGTMGTITLNGTGSQTYTYSSGGRTAPLIINKASGSVTPASGTTDLAISQLTLTQGSFTAPTGTLSIGYNCFINNSTINWITQTSGTLTPNGGTIVIDPSEAKVSNNALAYKIDVNTSLTVNNLTINGTDTGGTPATLTVATGDTLIIGGTLTLTDLAIAGNWEVQGDVTVGTTFDGGAAVFTYSGTANQTYTDNGGNEPDGDITINKTSGTVTLASNADWNATSQDTTVTSGTLYLAGYTLATGTLTVTDTLQLQGSETVTASSEIFNTSGVVEYIGDGDSAQDTFTITSQFTALENLVINSTDSNPDIFQLGATFTLTNDLTIQSGNILSLNGHNLSVSAINTTFSNDGTLRLQGGEVISNLTIDTNSGTTEYVGTTSYTGLAAGDSYYNLTFNGTAGTWTLDAALTTTGTITLTDGQLDVSASNYGISAAGWSDAASGDQFNPRSGTVTFTGGTVNTNEAWYAVAVAGSVTLSSAQDVNNNFTLTSGTLTTSGNDITVAGNLITTSGTVSGTDTITLDGTSQTISGNGTFYNLTKSVSSADTLTFANGSTQTVTGTLTITGTDASNVLSLRSDSAGTQWNINPTNVTVQYIDLKDSNNTRGSNITCDTGCINSGNNTGWVFPWAGYVYTDEGSTSIGSGKTVAISINGAAATTGLTDANGKFSITLPTDPINGDVLTFYLDGEVEKAVMVDVVNAQTTSGHDLYQNRLIVKDDNGSNIANSNLATADGNGDTDITTFYSLDVSNNLTVNTGYDLLIWAGDTFAPGANVTTDDITLNGTLSYGANAITVSGSWDTGASATLTGTGTVTVSGTTTETITSNSISFPALTVSGNGGHYNLLDALSVSGVLTIGSGATLDLNGFDFTNTGGSISNSGTLRMQGGETLTGFSHDTDSGTTAFDGTGTYSSLSGLTSFYNLSFVGTGTWTLGGNTDVNGSLTISAGTLDASAANNYSLTIGGNWTNTAGTFQERSGTVTFDATAGTNTINEAGSFYHLVFNDGGNSATFQLGAALDINGNLTITGGNLDVSSNNYAITAAGTWTNNDTFTAEGGTVTLDGTTQTIAGSTTFYNLTKTTSSATTLTFTAGTTQTVSGTWTATGASGQNLSLRSSSAGTQWNIAPTSYSLQYIDVQDSANTSGSTVLCSSDCTNSGNNSDWAFPLTVTVYTDEGSTGIGASKTVAVSVNGGSKTTADTNASSVATFTTVGTSPDDILTIWLDDESENGVTVTVTNATTLTFSLYQDHLLLEYESGSSITNTTLDTANNVSDSDIDAIYTVSSGNLTLQNSAELYINSGDTFIPGGEVNGDNFDINGTFTMGANDVTATGSWDATGGSFTASNTVTFSPTAAETIISNGSCFNNVTYSIGTGGSISNSDTLCINGTQTVSGSSAGGSSDTTAPTISSISVTAAETTATVIWTTNESADSSVSYGTTSGSLGSSESDTTDTIKHAVTLSGLTANTTYYYTVTSADTSNNSSSSETNSFTTLEAGTTADTTAPTISGISAGSVTSSGATISWTTSEATTSFVDYGESTEYDRSAGAGTGSATATSHSATLSGLAPSTTYNYRIVAIDAAGNKATSSNQTLSTSAEEDQVTADEAFTEEATQSSTDAPVITSEAPAVTGITSSEVTITWNTDKKSTSVVYYRTLNSDATPFQVGSPAFVSSHSVKLVGLSEATEYEYSVESTDVDGNRIRSKRYQFTTSLPEVANVDVNNVTADTAEFIYLTDAATQTVVELTNLLTGETITIEKDNIALEHRVSLTDLDPSTDYSAVILIRGADGSVSRSLAYIFQTQEDTGKPQIGTIETRSALVEGQQDAVQTIVTWTTNEVATSQVQFNEGVQQDVKDYTNSTEERQEFVTKHVVVLPDLQPSQVYQYRVRSVDPVGNESVSEPRVLLTPQRRVSALDLIIDNLEGTFGWVRQLGVGG